MAARKKISDQEEEIVELYDLQDELEQYTRKSSLEIPGEQSKRRSIFRILKIKNLNSASYKKHILI